MSKVRESHHPIADTVTACYARECNRTPRKEKSPWQWVNALCVVVAVVIVLVSTLIASVSIYRSQIGAGLPAHLSTTLKR